MTKKSSQKRGVYSGPVKSSAGRYARLAQTPVKLRSAGQELLRHAVEAEGFSLRQLEQITGLSKSTVSALLLGTRSPGGQNAETLERMFAVPANAWDRAPGWRPADWEPHRTSETSVLTSWCWIAGLLVPSKLSEARLSRDSCCKSKHTGVVEKSVELAWNIIGPELDKLSPTLKARLELPSGGQAPGDTLRTICIGMIHSILRHQHQALIGDLFDARAIHCAGFIYDLLTDVSDVPEVAA